MLLAKSRQFSPLERLAYIAILQGRVSTEGLAQILHVSRSTAARAVASLRRKSISIVGVRAPDGWHYEIRNAEQGAREHWRQSRLRKMAGFASGGRPERLKPEDDRIYGEP